MEELWDLMSRDLAGVDERGNSSFCSVANEAVSVPRPRWFRISMIRSVERDGTSLSGTGGRERWLESMDCTLGMLLPPIWSHDMWLVSHDVGWAIVPFDAGIMVLPVCEDEEPTLFPPVSCVTSLISVRGEASESLSPRLITSERLVLKVLSGKWRGEGCLLVGDNRYGWWWGLFLRVGESASCKWISRHVCSETHTT